VVKWSEGKYLKKKKAPKSVCVAVSRAIVSGAEGGS